MTKAKCKANGPYMKTHHNYVFIQILQKKKIIKLFKLVPSSL